MSALDLEALGRRLRGLGLSPRAVAACFGTESVIHAPLRRAPKTLVPAAVIPRLFVAGHALPIEAARSRLQRDYEALVSAGWLQQDEAAVRATRAIFPLGESLVVSDRFDCTGGDDAVMFPDDSALHLFGALPRRKVERWLDVGTGCGIAPLARRDLAPMIVGTDLHGRALELAALGASLSAERRIQWRRADLFEGIGERFDLITFNAPIPAEAGVSGSRSRYRHASAGSRILERFWSEAPRHLAPGGEVLVHSWLPPASYPPAAIGGRAVIARYTPPGAPIPFGVTRWQPDGSGERDLVQVTLAPGRDHVTRADVT